MHSDDSVLSTPSSPSRRTPGSIAAIGTGLRRCSGIFRYLNCLCHLMNLLIGLNTRNCRSNSGCNSTMRILPSPDFVYDETNSKRRNRMNQLTTKFDATTGESNGARLPAPPSLMGSLARVLVRLGILTEDLDYHLIRALMVVIFLFFGYQKWFEYEAQVLIP